MTMSNHTIAIPISVCVSNVMSNPDMSAKDCNAERKNIIIITLITLLKVSFLSELFIVLP